MDKNNYKPLPFEFRMSRRELIMALIYLPVHIFVLPLLLTPLMLSGKITEAEANFLIYAMGTGFMFGMLWGYMRKEFDPLCERPLYAVIEIFGHYGLMYIMNLMVNVIVAILLASQENPNNAAIGGMLDSDYGKIAAMTVIFAPIVEEIVFRGAVFGALRQKNRLLAYVVSVLLFSLYHVWGYMLADWKLIIFIIQYIPVSFLLCRLYERTSSIWSCIFMHMLVNSISIKTVLTYFVHL